MRRSPALDGLRGLAALLIVVLHAWLYTTTAAEKTDSVIDGAIHQMRLGVPLFFCLSGFLLYRGWVLAVRERRPTPRLADYARRRFWRIVPAYAFALLGSLILLAPLSGVRGVDVPDAGLLWLFAIFASNLHPDTVGALDPPMWTLAVEVQFYVLLPVVAAVALLPARRNPAWLLLAPAFLLLGGTAFNIAAANQPGNVVTASSLAALAPCFAAGMVAAVLADARPLDSRPIRAFLVIAGAALVIANGVWHENDAGEVGRIIRDLPAALGIAMLLLVLARPGEHMPGARQFAALGNVSYPIYLWHMPIMLGLRGAGFFPESRPLAALAMTLGVTIPVACASWVLIERPTLRWASRRSEARRPASRRAARPASEALARA